ncbi:ArsA family ATPase [Thermoleophilia bacterium SCSIO 60948]|nr:ArsA family ATPase [Thermoleophilia bacterium SCSIO 60948]
MSGPSPLDRLLAERRVLVVAGPGGVGKTTVSAAIAAQLARGGASAAVLTIDPARRLADALGLDEIGGAPRRVDPEALRRAGLVEGPGELWAMALDAKQTFDRTVERHAPDDASRQRILANPIYARISEALAGSHEYMAIEALHELAERDEFDFLVLDTPPSQQAADFLTAPTRLLELFQGRGMRLVVRSAGAGGRIAGRGAALMFSLLRRITGVDLLRDLAEFFDAIAVMVDGMAERAAEVRALLADPATGFVLVSSPDPEPAAETAALRRRLDEDGLNYAGAVLNRVALERFADPRSLAAEIAAATPGAEADLAAALQATLERLAAESARHADAVERARAELGGPLVLGPRSATAPVDLEGLARLLGSLRPG